MRMFGDIISTPDERLGHIYQGRSKFPDPVDLTCTTCSATWKQRLLPAW